MKKKILTFIGLFLISGLSTIFFSACDDDTNCYVRVSVIDEATKMPVSGVFVKIDIDSSYINAQGTTDMLGQFFAQFTAPAIYNVSIKKEGGYDTLYTPDQFYCYRKGNNTIRLKEGDTVETTVILESTIIREYLY